MKCDKCGYDDKGTGDFAHVCGPISVRPSMHAVEIGRITKKMNKLKDQRDKARNDVELYKKMLQIVPQIASRYEEYNKRKALEDELRALRLRVKEQSILIAKLTT